MDALADVLGSLRLSGGVFLDAEFTAPWCVASKVGPEDCRPLMPEPARLVAYHYVAEGRLLLGHAGGSPVPAAAGQLLVLPRNDAHLLGSSLDLQPANADDLIEPAGSDGLARIRFGGGGARTRVLCGFLGCDDRNDPLISGLPAVMRLDLGDGPAGPWVEGSIRYAARELAAGGPGAASSLALLAGLLFAEAVRGYLRTLPRDARGWLAGLRDPFVGRALALLHGRPAHPWTLADLAREVGLSRSALADRFSRQIGTSPIRYACRRRLQLAAERLRAGPDPVSRIAHEAGYETEAAFGRAFRREFGVPPGSFRKGALRP